MARFLVEYAVCEWRSAEVEAESFEAVMEALGQTCGYDAWDNVSHGFVVPDDSVEVTELPATE